MVYIHTSVCLEICNVLVLSCTTVSVRSKQSGLPKFNANTHTHANNSLWENDQNNNPPT